MAEHYPLGLALKATRRDAAVVRMLLIPLRNLVRSPFSCTTHQSDEYVSVGAVD